MHAGRDRRRRRITGYGAMALLALTASLFMTGGSPVAASAASTTASAATTAPSPAEGHSPRVTQALSGPLSGTGAARPGSSAAMSPAMRQATAAAASTMVNGVDVSSVQDSTGSAINWANLAAAGDKFAGIKATEGNYYVNPGYAGDAKNAAAAGLYVSAYAFANPYGAASNPP
ncbi:MAG: hypothetical protein FWE35_27460, partial [Streptosporangiales bacterium]|nr:hypothetical protein [Streptosporangiales bacterium]